MILLAHRRPYCRRLSVFFLFLAALLFCHRSPQAALPTAQQERLRTTLQQAEANLKESVLPFWARTYDEKYGGFITIVDREGKPKTEDGSDEKRVIMQARLVWTFAAAHRYGIRDKGYLELARKGFEFLTQKMWDEKHGGFYLSVARDGTPKDTTKLTYAHSFVIYALSEYSIASGDKDALRWAEKTFDVLQTKTRDGAWGYLEDFNRDWTLAKLSGSVANVRSGKTLNTHMHLMEAFTTLARASKKDKHRRALREVTQLLMDKTIHPKYGCAMEPFDFNWNPKPDQSGRFVTSYGHNVEFAWLLMDAARAAQMPMKQPRKIALGLMEHAMRFGLDEERGGIAQQGPYVGKATETAPFNQNMKKSWWEQSENLIATVEAFEWTRDAKYLQVFEKQWSWIWQHQIDHEKGDWFSEVEWTSGEPLTTDKGHYGWKVSYHNGRALMRTAQALRRILK